MSLEENKAVVRRFFDDVFNGGNLDVVDELFDPEHRIHNPYISEEKRGPEPMKDFVWFSRRIVPNLEVVVEDEKVDGEKVVTRWTLAGSLADKLQTYDVGEEVTVSGNSAFELSDDGMITDTWLQCESNLAESQGQVPEEEFREWMFEDVSTAGREASHLRSRPLDDPTTWSPICCIFGMKWCCHEFPPPDDP